MFGYSTSGDVGSRRFPDNTFGTNFQKLTLVLFLRKVYSNFLFLEMVVSLQKWTSYGVCLVTGLEYGINGGINGKWNGTVNVQVTANLYNSCCLINLGG